jgi:uncharacterized protein YndB with AHSA1/START domain
METKLYEGKAEMLIRKPANIVFDAIVDPTVTTRFWFTKSSGRLTKDAKVKWEWEMYGVSAQVRVLEIDPNRRILIEWSGENQPTTTVEWQLAPRTNDTTFVSVSIPSRNSAASRRGGWRSRIGRAGVGSSGSATVLWCRPASKGLGK